MRSGRIIRFDAAILCALMIGISSLLLIPLIEGEDDITLWNQDFTTGIMYATNDTVVWLLASNDMATGEMNEVTIQDLNDTDDDISASVYDDGTHGDSVAGDGVYTGSFTLVDDEGGSRSRTDDTIDIIDIGSGHSVRITVDLDQDGNASFADITADFTAPEIVLLSDLTRPYGHTFPLEARVTDDHVDETTLWYSLDDEQPQTFEQVVKDNGATEFLLSSDVNCTDLQDGSHRITIGAGDLAGNAIVGSWIIVVDTTPPTLNLTHIFIDDKRGVVLHALVHGWDEDPSSVMWKWNDGEWMFPDSTDLSMYIFRQGFEHPLQGKNTIEVIARDAANNTVTGSITFNYTEPRFQDLRINAPPLDDERYPEGETVEVRFTVSNHGKREIRLQLDLVVDGVALDQSQTMALLPNESNGSFFGWLVPEPGIHNISILLSIQDLHPDDVNEHSQPVTTASGGPIVIQEDDEVDPDDEFPRVPTVLGGALLTVVMIGGFFWISRKRTSQQEDDEIPLSEEPIVKPPSHVEVPEIPGSTLPGHIMHPVPPPFQMPDPDSPPPEPEGSADVPMVPLDVAPPTIIEDPSMHVPLGKPDLTPRFSGPPPEFKPPVLPPGVMHPVPPPNSDMDYEMKPVAVARSNDHLGEGEEIESSSGIDIEPDISDPADGESTSTGPSTTTDTPTPQSPAALPTQSIPEPIPSQPAPVPPSVTREPTPPPTESQCADCCDEIRAQNNGILTFGNDDQTVEINGNTIKMTVNGVEQEWTLDFNVEDVFCNLGDYQIVGALTTTTTSSSSGGSLKEEISSTNTTLSGPTPDTASTGLNQTLSFASQIIDPDGNIRESSLSLTMDSEECSYQLQTMINGQINEFMTEPPLDLRTLHRLWHNSDEGIWSYRGHRWRSWWDEMWRFLLHMLWWEGWEQDHPNDDDRRILEDILTGWRRRLIESVVGMLVFQQDLTPEQLRDIRELEQALDSEAPLSEIVLKFMKVWNHFHEGFPFDD